MATTKITQVGKRIVNDSSLIFYYDMSNTIRSFKGAPTTNLFAEDSDGVGGINRPPSATADFSQWDFTGTTYTEYLPNREVKIQENSTSTASRYLLLNSRCLASKDYTFSAYFKPLERKHIQIAPSTNFPQGSYANYTLEGEGTITGPGSAKATIKLMKAGSYTGWYRCTYTEISNATNSNNSRFALSLADTDSLTRLAAYAATSGYGVLIRDPQFEQSSFATPFVDGTRSSTETIVDLTGTFTPNASALTYNADGTFSYSGATANGGKNDRITVGIGSYPTAWTDPFSIEAWFKIPSGADWQDTVSGGDNSGTGIVSRGDYAGAIGLWTKDLTKIRFTARSGGNLYGHIHDAQFDTWYHMVGTHDGGTTNALKTYVNGVLVGTNSFTNQGDAPDQQNWIVGGSNALGGAFGGYFEGDIPIVRIYSKALTAAEVKQNFIAHRKQFGL